MSTTIDERVVSMQFDNAQFERNVQQSMSTLDKLKEKLHLPGATKGLNDINTAAKNVNLTPIGSAAETVGLKFNAMYTMADQALRNITNSVYGAAKRMANALFVAPVKDGWQEYEMTLNAVQTTMAGTGKTAEEVEKELKKLDEYADKTVYSTSDMLNNLPKFTNAGIELETATKAMIGIANATALAGGDAAKASIAYYNLGQAMSTGYLTRMDYNSINNAGIATMEWKNQMVEAAVAAGTLKKAGEDAYIAGGKTFSLQQLFIEGLQHQWATTDVMMKVFEDYGDEQTEIGKKAYSAAQDIKTYTQMMESLKATAGTGWKDTWQIIFGDLDAAKKFWTGLTNAISAVINKMADIRNGFLESVLGRNFVKTVDKAREAFKPIAKTVDGVKEAVSGVTKTLEEHKAVVDSVIRGDWGNYTKRWDALTEAGYDWAHVQNLVNEELGYSLRRETSFNDTQKETVETTAELNEENAKLIEDLVKLSDAELKAKGYTEDQIKAFRNLEKVADKLGLSISDLISKSEEIDGRWLIIESFKNFAQPIIKIFKSIGQAWNDVFDGKNYAADFVFNLIAALHKLSTKFKMSDKTADKLRRTFAGLFAILDVLLTLTAGPIKIAFKIFNKLLNVFGMDILDVTAGIGDAMVKFSDWLDEFDLFGKGVKFISPFLKRAVKGVKDWFNWLKEGGHSPKEIADSIVQGLSKGVKMVGEIFGELKKIIAKKVGTVPEDLISGLVNGIRDKGGFVWEVIVSLGETLLKKFREVLGIHSPSTETYSDGVNFILGFFNALRDMAVTVWDWIKEFGLKCVKVIKDIDFGTLFAGALAAGTIFTAIKFVGILGKLAGPFDEFAEVLTKVKKVVGAFSGTVRSFNLLLKAQALKTVAEAVAIIAAAIAGLTLVDTDKAWDATWMIVIIAGALAGAVWVLSKAMDSFSSLNDSKSPKEAIKKTSGILKVIGLLLAIAGSMALLAVAVSIFAKMEEDDIAQATKCIGGLLVAMALMVGMTKIPGANDVGLTLLEMAGSMLILAIIAKMMGNVQPDQLENAKEAFKVLLVVMALMVMMTMVPGVNEAKLTLMGIAGAMLILAIVVKMMAGISKEELKAALPGFGLLLLIIGILLAGVVLFTRFAKNEHDLKRVGLTMLLLSLSIGILAGIAVLLGHVNPHALTRGIVAVGALALIVGLLVAATGLSKDAHWTILAIAVSIAVLTACVIALSFIDPDKMWPAVGAIGILMYLFGMITLASSVAKDSAKSLFAIALVIAIMAAAVYFLSDIPTDGLIASAGALGGLMVALIGVLIACKKAGKDATKAAATLLIVSLVVGLIGFVIYQLAQLPVRNVIASAIALGGLLLVMAGVLYVCKSMGKDALKAIPGILALTLLIAPLFVIVWALKELDGVDNVAENAIALSAMLIAFSVVIGILTAIAVLSGSGSMALVGVLALTALVVPLLAFIGALALLNAVENVQRNVDLLMGMLMTMTAVLVVLAIVGPLALIGVAAMTGLTLLMGAIGAFAVGVGALMEKFPQLEDFLNRGLPVLEKLATSIGTCIGNVVAGFMNSVGESLPAFGTALSDFMNNAEDFINGAKNIDGKVLKGVGILSAAVLALTYVDFIEGVSSFMQRGSSFSDLGTELSKFINNAEDFILNAPLLDSKVAQGVNTIAQAVLILTAADVIEGLTSWFTGGNSLENFAEELPSLGEGIAGFASAVSSFNASDMDTVAAAADAIKYLAKASQAVPNTGGLLQDIIGENDLDQFAKDMPKLGEGIAGFADKISDLSTSDCDTVKSAADCIKALVNATKGVTRSGGWIQDLIGEQDLETFAKNMPLLGTGIASFANSVGTFDDTKAGYVSSATKAIAAMIEATKEIPNENGWIQKLIGSNADAVSSFATNMGDLGTGLSDFAKNTDGLDAAKVTLAIGVLAALIGATNQIDVDKGKWYENLFGTAEDSSVITHLCDNLPSLGTALKTFASNIGTIDNTKIDKTKKVVSSFVSLLNAVTEFNTMSLTTVEAGQNIVTMLTALASGITLFIDDLIDYSIEDIETAISKIQGFIDAAESLEVSDIVSAEDFAADVTELLYELDRFTQGLNDATQDAETFAASFETFFGTTVTLATSHAEGSFPSLGRSIIKAIGKGLDEDIAGNKQYSVMATKLSVILNKTKKQLNNLETAKEYKTVGNQMIAGIVKGLNEKSGVLYSTARSIIRKSITAMNDEADINSPSRETYKIGDYFGLGFLNALINTVPRAYDAGADVANSAKNGLSNAISKIRNSINADIDVQPTIRPVLDLSDVRTGANSISNMFRNGVTIGANANINAVNSSMRGYRQNGNNDDVVSAIDSLRSDVKNLEAASYTINGVTYDDGSNITEAVKSIVTAARVRRRS